MQPNRVEGEKSERKQINFKGKEAFCVSEQS